MDGVYIVKRIKSFVIGSHKINVKYQKKLINKETGEEVLGLFIPLKNAIYVSTEYRGEPLCEDAIDHSLHHEIAHCMMVMMSKWDLNVDEVFIDTMGLHLSQINKTKK